MRTRRLGNSGLLVSEIALGTMVFGEASGRGTPPEEAVRIINAFIEAGGNHFDLANVYAGGRSEEIVGEALKGRRADAILATKVRWPMGAGPNHAGLSRRHICDAVEASLKRLHTDVIDVLYMHGWDALTPLEESLRTFDDLLAAGKVRYIGVSNFAAWQVMKGLGLSDKRGWAKFIAAQYQYSLVVRDIEEEITPLCLSEGVSLVPWGPLGGGFLSGKYRPDHRPTGADEGRIATTPEAWEESWENRATDRNWRVLKAVQDVVARHSGATPAQVAIAWLLAQPAVASVVAGARTLEQFEVNIRAAALDLSPEDLRTLEQASAVPKGYPARSVNLTAR